MCRLTQLNIHLNYETACYLQEVSVMEDEPMTEILRQSVSMHHFSMMLLLRAMKLFCAIVNLARCLLLSKQPSAEYVVALLVHHEVRIEHCSSRLFPDFASTIINRSDESKI